jgi:hypothetical protein
MEPQVYTYAQSDEVEQALVSNHPTIDLLLGYLEETTQFMLLLPRLRNAETKECSAHRNIHIKIYACLLYETKDKIGLQVVQQVQDLQDKFNVMLNSIAYSFSTPLTENKIILLRCNFRPKFAIQERLLNMLIKCRDIIGFWPVGRLVEYRTAIDMASLFTFLFVTSVDRMVQAGHKLDDHLPHYMAVLKEINASINRVHKVEKPASIIPHPEF